MTTNELEKLNNGDFVEYVTRNISVEVYFVGLDKHGMPVVQFQSDNVCSVNSLCIKTRGRKNERI